MALANEGFYITPPQHTYFFKGIPTKKKLRILETKFNREPMSLDYLNDVKQKHTEELIESWLESKPEKIEMMRELKAHGIKVGVASNAVRNSVEKMLAKTGILEFVDASVSNEDVSKPKPAADMYYVAAEKLGVDPRRMMIVEDSEVGRMAARAVEGSTLCAVDDPTQVDLGRLGRCVDHIGKMKIVVPMAGYGSRFAKAGYTFPKPLIDVDGKPMIQRVIENVMVPNATFVFIVQAEHRQKYALDRMLNKFAPNCEIIEVDKVTEGAACTVLLAKNFIDDNNELMIVNSDQLVEIPIIDYVLDARKRNLRGSILCFPSTHPKWSYARLDDAGYVLEVREKEPISDIATVGIYYFARGCDYVKAAVSMIEKNIRVNNEFYVCPVYNEAIEMINTKQLSGDYNGIGVYNIPQDSMVALGLPEDLQAYLGKRNANPDYRRMYP
jgi:HAD superfamily hydrolase (TIGR01509 family)